MSQIEYSFKSIILLKLQKLSNFLSISIGNFGQSYFHLVLFFFIFSLQFGSVNSLQISSINSPTFNSTFVSERQLGLPVNSFQFVLLIILFVIFISQKFRAKIKFLTYEILLFIFFAMGLLSVLNSYNLTITLVWLLKVTAFIITYLIFSRYKFNNLSLNTILLSFLAILLIQGIISVAQFFKGDLIGLPFEELKKYNVFTTDYRVYQLCYFRPFGTLSNPTNLTSFLALLLPFSFALNLSKNYLYRWLSRIVLIFLLILPLLNLSRWGLVTILFGFFIVVFLTKKFFKRNFFFRKDTLKKLAIGGSFLLLLFFINPCLSYRFGYIDFDETSLSGRIGLIQQSIYILNNFTSGVGGGAFSVFFINNDFTENNLAKKFPAPVHNFYLLIMSELGDLSIIVVILLLTAIIIFFVRTTGKLNSNKLYFIVAFSSILIFFFNGLWEPLSFDSRVGMLFGIVLGIFTNLGTNRSKLNSKDF